MSELTLTAATRKRPYSAGLVLALICVSCLFSRVVLGYALRGSFEGRGNRTSSIVVIAQTLARSGEFGFGPGQPTAANEPLYTALIALCYAVPAPLWLTVAVLQALLAVLNAVVLYRIAMSIFRSEAISLVSAAGFAFYPFLVTQSISIADTTLFCSLMALATYLTMRAVETRQTGAHVAAGAVWGLLLLVRLSGLALFLPSLLYVAWSPDLRRSLARAALVASTAGVMLVPWIARNYALTDKLLVTTHGAIELWFGYNDRTMEVLASDVSVDVLRADIEDQVPALRGLEGRTFQAPINREVAESEILVRQAEDYVKSDPAAVVRMMPLKLWKFWSWFKNPATNSLVAERGAVDRAWDLLYTVYYLPTLLLAAVGVVLTRRQWRRYGILLLQIAGYSAFHALVYGFTRLRIPLDQFLIVFASVALVYFWSSIRDRKRSSEGLSMVTAPRGAVIG